MNTPQGTGAVDDRDTTVASSDDARADTGPAGGSTVAADAAAEPPSEGGRRGRDVWRVVPWVLAVVGLGLAAFSTWQWLDLRAAEQDRAAVQAAAADFVLTLTNWDARDGLDDTVDALRAAGSERFLEEIDTLFGSGLRQELEQVRAVSTGEIQDVFVQSIDEREAVVFAVVVQRIEVGLEDAAADLVRSARIALREADGEWLVTRVELVNDSGLDLGEEVAP